MDVTSRLTFIPAKYKIKKKLCFYIFNIIIKTLHCKNRIFRENYKNKILFLNFESSQLQIKLFISQCLLHESRKTAFQYNTNNNNIYINYLWFVCQIQSEQFFDCTEKNVSHGVSRFWKYMAHILNVWTLNIQTFRNIFLLT